MTNLTTPKAILIGLSLIAAAIATTPFSGSLITTASAHHETFDNNVLDHYAHTKEICGHNGKKPPFNYECAMVVNGRLLVSIK